ncbi:MAG: hypothetical protein CMQ41_07245 [Gammaproteobacteria bacterium]|nr:hypothetical protein [Gammaproteobacteria bacterium]
MYKKAKPMYSAFFTLITLVYIPSLALAQSLNYRLPRTEFGDPNLQGLWEKRFATPVERPANLGNKRAYTNEEAVVFEQRAIERRNAREAPVEADRGAPPVGGNIEFRTDTNFLPDMPVEVARINGELRTSLIIEPENGRFPLRDESMEFRARYFEMMNNNFDGPEARPPGERCLHLGPPLPTMTNADGTHIQIVQTQDYIVIYSEEAIQTRIIKLNKEHPENSIQKWMGDSIGHWEGETLVIHTDNFRPEHTVSQIASSEEFEVTERITAISQNELLYAYTIVDPITYTAPVVAELPFTRMPAGQKLYESACHEGNRAVMDILMGARIIERDLMNQGN